MPSPARVRQSSALAVICCTLLVLLLPAVVAALSVANPRTDGESARIERALSRDPARQIVDSSIGRLFHTATIPAASWPVAATQRQQLVVRARRSQLFAVTALGLLTYLSVLLARGRLQALFAVALLACLPPLGVAGHILRPETPAVLFAMLSLVLMQSASLPLPRRRRRHPRRALLMTSGLMVCAAIAAAMACEALPSLGEALLVPGVILVVGAAQHGLRGVRCLSRRGLLGTPIRALNQRLLPWTAMALLAPVFTWWLLQNSHAVPVDAMARTVPASDLLPASTLGWLAVCCLLLVGVVSGVVRVGMRFGRGGRIGPDLVLLVFCAIYLLVAQTSERAEDPLPMAPALAIVLSEGLRTLLVLVMALGRRLRRA